MQPARALLGIDPGRPTVWQGVRRWRREALRNPIASDAGFLALSQYAAAGVGLLTAVVAARLLGPREYGSAALVIAYPTLVWSFAAVKSISVTTRYLAGFAATGRTEQVRGVCKLGYGMDLLAALGTLLLVLATSGWLARTAFADVPGARWLAVAYAASLPLYSLNGTSGAVLASWRRFGWLAVFQVLEKLVTLGLTLALVARGWGAAGVVLAAAAGQIASGVSTTAGATIVLRQAGVGPWWNASLRPVAGHRRELASFFGWNYVVATLGGVLTQAPLILLGEVRGPGEAGFFRLASSITTAGSYLESALGRVVYPLLSARTATEATPTMLAEVRRWTVRGGVPACLLLLGAIPALALLLPRVLGPEYARMVPGTQAMIAGAAASAAVFWLAPLYYASGRIVAWAASYAAYTIATLAVTWLVAPAWGFSGVACVLGAGKTVLVLALAAPLLAVRGVRP